MIDIAAPTCGSALRITATTGVTCALPELHASADTELPASHQGVHDGLIYVWSSRDANMMRTFRDMGEHEACDLMARKLAVDPRLARAVSG